MTTKPRTEAELRAIKRQENPPKSKFGNPTESKPQEALPVKADAPPTSPSGDQKPVPATKAGDQNDVNAKAKKSKKKPSPTVVLWKDQENLPVTGKITVKPEHRAKNPKRGKAAVRFEIYKDGMTVGEYLDASKKAGNPTALATADVRWDVVKGFIEVK